MKKFNKSHLPGATFNNLRRLGAAYNKILTGPERILIRMTSACDLNCIYCWDHSPYCPPHRKAPAFMPFETIKKTILAASKWDAQEVILSGNGEPTLHPNFSSIISFAKKKGVRLSLLTNGTFPSNLLPVIANIDNISVNLSAPDALNYSKLQSPRSRHKFQQVIRNLKTLAMLQEKNKKPSIKIIFIVSKPSYPLIPAMLKLTGSIGIQTISFKRFSKTEHTGSLAISKHDKKILSKIIANNIKKKWPFSHNLGSLEEAANNKPITTTSCLIGWFELTVELNKKVGFCCCNTSDRIIGDLNRSSLEEIWHGPRAQELRLQYKKGVLLSKYPRCQECLPEREKENLEISLSIQKRNISPA